MMPPAVDALTLNIKTHSYKYAPGSEIICICNRIYYKPLQTLNPHCRMVNKPVNETILIETNFNKSEITTRRTIKWEEIEFPENWTIEKAVPSLPNTQNNPTKIIQTLEGEIQISFEKTRKSTSSMSRPYMGRSNSSHYHISPVHYTVRSPSRVSTSQIRETESFPEKEYEEPSLNKVEELRIRPDNIVKGVYSLNVEDITPSEMNFSV